MTEEQHIAAVELVNATTLAVNRLVNETMKGVDPVVEELARTMLTENYRFWRKE